MKHTHLCFFFLLFLALTSESISILSTTSLGDDVKPGKIKTASVGTTMVEDDTNINELMGLGSESCEDRYEECLNRRLISEAHLDYIYTQKNKN